MRKVLYLIFMFLFCFKFYGVELTSEEENIILKLEAKGCQFYISTNPCLIEEADNIILSNPDCLIKYNSYIIENEDFYLLPDSYKNAILNAIDIQNNESFFPIDIIEDSYFKQIRNKTIFIRTSTHNEPKKEKFNVKTVGWTQAGAIY